MWVEADEQARIVSRKDPGFCVWEACRDGGSRVGLVTLNVEHLCVVLLCARGSPYGAWHERLLTL